MFTGIVQGTAKIVSIEKREKFQTHAIHLPDTLIAGLEIGASVSHNGCCLTVTKIEQNTVYFDLMQATLCLTNLGDLKEGDFVNVERAAKIGDEIGGHLMSGHIIGTATISERIDTADNCTISFAIPAGLKKYILDKGYIGIDGISLTIAAVNDTDFSVCLIPETLTRTNLQWRKVGDRINLEIDTQTQAIVETVERVLAQKSLT